MARNTSKIKEGIRALTDRPFEIISGTVVAGSVDTTGYTMSVQPVDGDPIAGVMLSSVTDNGNGILLVPKDGSNVIIGSIDGPGKWTLIRASELLKTVTTIGNVICEVDDSQVNIQNGNTVLNVGEAVFKINTAGESLFSLLKDLITGLTVLTVGTPSGPSTVPVNVASFNDLLVRLNNLLSA